MIRLNNEFNNLSEVIGDIGDVEENLTRSFNKVVEQIVTLNAEMKELDLEFDRLSDVINENISKKEVEDSESMDPMDHTDHTDLTDKAEEMEEVFERHHDRHSRHSRATPNEKKQRMMLYTHRATRIEMMAIEKRRINISKGKKISNGKKNNGKGCRRVTLDFQKVKKVVDQGRKKLNKDWQRANRPRDTRPWIEGVENN
jgi:hypothetical protein